MIKQTPIPGELYANKYVTYYIISSTDENILVLKTTDQNQLILCAKDSPLFNGNLYLIC